MYIKNYRNSSEIKSYGPIEHCSELKINASKSATFHILTVGHYNKNKHHDRLSNFLTS